MDKGPTHTLVLGGGWDHVWFGEMAGDLSRSRHLARAVEVAEPTVQAVCGRDGWERGNVDLNLKRQIYFFRRQWETLRMLAFQL